MSEPSRLVHEMVEGTVSRDPFSYSSTAFVRRTKGGPIAVADDTGSPMATLEKAGLLPGRAYGQVLRKPLMLQEEVITADHPVTVLGRPRRKGGRVMVGRRGVLSAADPETWIATLDADTRSSAARCGFSRSAPSPAQSASS